MTMKTLEIRNIKTSKTERQLQDEVLVLKSKKNLQLVNTDWTQLEDVTLTNVEDFRSWREELRNLKVKDKSDSAKLEEIISRKPVPVFGETTKVVTLPPKMDVLDEWGHNIEICGPVRVQSDLTKVPILDPTSTEIKETPVPECTTREEATNILIGLLTAEKSNSLQAADASSYALFRLLQEELIEYDYNTEEAPPKFLEKYMTAVGMDARKYSELVQVEKYCKDYFARINEIFFRFEKQSRRVYNMSNEELQSELKNRGHRYRYTDQG